VLQNGAIPIGIGVAQTSNTALLGQEEVTGAKIAEKYFNDQGGVNGTPIKLIYQDTAGDENGAINAFQTLINQDNVVGIVGPTLSQQAFSADPIADRAHVPVIAPSNTAKGIPQIGDYIARVTAPVAVVAPNAVDAALGINANIKNVAVAYAQDDAFSKSETGTFQDTVKSKNLNLTTVQTFSTKDTDFTTQATAILNTQPDLIIISGLAADKGARGGEIIKWDKDAAIPLGLDGDYIRDENEQARYLRELLEIFTEEGVDSAFVFTFVLYQLPHRGQPRKDLDMGSYAIVEVYEERFGDSYPDMIWEPKAAFSALAEYYRG
jgi:ABC-type branched-subunit amino acid transport system substrate-binding protein